MSLQIVAGSSGSGKSCTLYQDIVAHAARNPRQPHMVLVPEQFTLSTQRRLVMLSPKKGIMNIEVLSFERLAWRVFDELGTDVRDVLEDTGKSLLLRRICSELKPELKTLTGSINKPGFIDELKSLLSEFGQYGISPEDMGDFLDVKNMPPGFYGRMEDISRIYRGFFDALEGKYITAEQILFRLSEVLYRSAFVKDAYVICDGYTGFTPVQNRVFSVMLSMAQIIRVAVTIDAAEWDKRADETDLFAMSHEFIGSMVRIANNTGASIDKPLLLKDTGGKRFKEKSALSHLESNIFRVRSKSDANGDIVLNSFDDPGDEIRYVMSVIRERIRTESSLKYRDFAVLCADINDYRYLIEQAAIQYDIPVFVDSKDQVMRSPFIELVEAIAHMFSSDFSYESIMRYLKCGFSPLSEDEIDSMDNYLITTGIHGKKRLENIFDRFAQGVTSEELVELNEARASMMEVFKGHGSMEKKATVISHTRTLYNIITGLKCNDKINEERKQLEEKGEYDEALRLEQLYPKVMELLDKLVFLMGEVELAIDEYEQVLAEGLKAIRLGVIPPAYDSVTFGDMERTRIGETDTLFLIGMSDARIPKRFDGGGLLLQSERERLSENNIVLAPTDRQKAFFQRFYLYMAICRPKNRLYLTYPVSMEDEQQIREAYVISNVRDCFNGLETVHIPGEELSYRSACDNTLDDVLADELREYLGEQRSDKDEYRLFSFLAYLKKTDEKKYTRLLDAAGFRYENSRLSKAVMDAIYPKELSISASRLERYARCAYSYYLNYILALEERKEQQIGYVDMGNLYHEALERYSNKLKEDGISWHEVTEQESQRVLEESINDTFLALNEVRFAESARENYLLYRMKRTLKRTVDVLTKQVRQGSFIPESFEVSLSRLSGGYDEPLSVDGKTVKPSGIIDRMDICETDDKVYIKIIDYKSGMNDTDISDAYDGLQLQLFLYADAAKRAVGSRAFGKEAQCAAVLYYQVKDPIIETEKEVSLSELDELVTKELKFRGLVCDEREVVEALDKGFREAALNNQKYASAIIPVEIKRDGDYTAASHVVSRNEFDIIQSFAVKKAEEIAGDILNGRIDVNPYVRHDQSTACDYCPYHSVCEFDGKLPGYSGRKLLEEKDKDTVIRLMSEKTGDVR